MERECYLYYINNFWIYYLTYKIEIEILTMYTHLLYWCLTSINYIGIVIKVIDNTHFLIYSCILIGINGRYSK